MCTVQKRLRAEAATVCTAAQEQAHGRVLLGQRQHCSHRAGSNQLAEVNSQADVHSGGIQDAGQADCFEALQETSPVTATTSPRLFSSFTRLYLSVGELRARIYSSRYKSHGEQLETSL